MARATLDHPSDQQAADPFTAQDTAPDDADALEGEILGPNQLRLSDGRLVDIARTRGPHDERVDMLLSRCGYSLAGMGALVYMRYRALLAIEFVEGRVQKFPRTKEQLLDRLNFDTEDIEAIQAKYAKINGLKNPTAAGDDEDGDFRS